VSQVRHADLVDLEVFVTIRPTLNVLKSLVLLQSVDRSHVTDPKVIQFGRVKETIRKKKAILKKTICFFSSLNGLDWVLGSMLQNTKKKRRMYLVLISISNT